MSYDVTTTDLPCPAKCPTTLEHYEDGSHSRETGPPRRHYACPTCFRMYDVHLDRLEPWKWLR